jgi:predicted permease
MFQIVFLNVLLALLFMVPGYVFCKIKIAKPEHLSTVSTFLIYFCSPCMVLSAFFGLPKQKEYAMLMGLFFVFSLMMQILFFLILFLIFRKKHENPIYRLLNVGSVLGNVGFFGLPLIRAVFPDAPEVACYSSIYVVSMNLLVFTIGVYCITGDKNVISFKNAILNPATFSLIIALPLYFFNGSEWFPEFLKNGIDVVGKSTTPICMFILGVRLAAKPLKEVFGNKAVYAICALKLIAFPLFCFGLSLLFPLPPTFRYSVLILAGTPCASVILGMAEIHGKCTDLAANCILLSTLLSILTLPVLALLIQV